METILRDFRYGIRTLGRTPGFSLTAIVVMALGLGSTIALFTVVHSVLLKSLPPPGIDPGAATTRLIASLLYGTQPLDLAVFVVVTCVLLAVAVTACLIPAWRASQLDPMQALRTE